MHVTRNRLKQDRRGSISVEMALTGLFVLFPLLAGGADFLELIAAKAQLNATLRSLYAYAWNNPGSATNTSPLATILTVVNQHSLPRVTFPDGKADATTSYQPALSYGCIVPPASSVTYQTIPCPAADTEEVFVTYDLISSVSLPVPMPFNMGNPFVLAASGQVELQ